MAKKKEFFEVINLNREDIKENILGVDADNLTDKQMEEICKKINEILLNTDWWETVECACNVLGLVKFNTSLEDLQVLADLKKQMEEDI